MPRQPSSTSTTLREPRFSPEAQQIRDMMAAMAPDCPLDADVLHAKAAAETGLDDFGDDDYRERLDVYLAALHEISRACSRPASSTTTPRFCNG